jgi:hypothetical protein
LVALEDFFAYPGPRLMKALAERISGALLSGSYRYDGNEWEMADDAAEAASERLSPTFSGGDTHRPYFEALFVTPAPAASRAKTAGELRRTDDAMIYEPVLVGSVEDALLATILNGKIEAVVIFDGIPVPSQHDVPLLRDLLASRHQLDTSNLAPREVGVTLARLIKRIRPELDLYLLTDRNVEKLAGDPAAAMFRRVFYERSGAAILNTAESGNAAPMGEERARFIRSNDHEQETAPQPFGGIQGQGGAGRRQRRQDSGRDRPAVRGASHAGHRLATPAARSRCRRVRRRGRAERAAGRSQGTARQDRPVGLGE